MFVVLQEHFCVLEAKFVARSNVLRVNELGNMHAVKKFLEMCFLA